MLKAVQEVENMDAPGMKGWFLLRTGRKLGHTKEGEMGTREMIIDLFM